MIKCSGCKAEYDDMEKACPECGLSKDAVKSDIQWIVLTTVKNDIEFEMLRNVLELADIPAIRNVKGVDGFAQIILGAPIAGIDVMVPEDRFDEAVQLMGAQAEDMEAEYIDDEATEEEKEI